MCNSKVLKILHNVNKDWVSKVNYGLHISGIIPTKLENP